MKFPRVLLVLVSLQIAILASCTEPELQIESEAPFTGQSFTNNSFMQVSNQKDGADLLQYYLTWELKYEPKGLFDNTNSIFDRDVFFSFYPEVYSGDTLWRLERVYQGQANTGGPYTIAGSPPAWRCYKKDGWLHIDVEVEAIMGDRSTPYQSWPDSALQSGVTFFNAMNEVWYSDTTGTLPDTLLQFWPLPDVGRNLIRFKKRIHFEHTPKGFITRTSNLEVDGDSLQYLTRILGDKQFVFHERVVFSDTIVN